MSKAKYEIFLIREQLHKKEKLIKIYENNDNNNDILKAVDELLNEIEKEKENDNKKDEELHSKLLLFRDDIYTYIQQEIRDNDLKKQISINNSLIYENKDLKKTNNDLSTLVKELKKEISELKSTVNNNTNQITQLKRKV